MSVKLSSYVWDGCAASGMKISKVAIMARLADFSNDEGLSWPSVETIARQIGAGQSTVRTALKELESDGWVTSRQRRQGNRNATNVYQLNVKKLRAASQASESDTSKSDPSEFDGSKSDTSKSDPSKSSKKAGFHPPESGGDPLVSSKEEPSVKKTSCQLPAETDREVQITDDAKSVLQHLNQLTNRRWQVSKSSLSGIRGRLNEGFTAEQLILTVDYMVEKWRNDEEMCDFLRPTTLFQPTKFPGYQGSSEAWDKKGRPARVNGKWVHNSRLTQATSDIPEGFNQNLPAAPTQGGNDDGLI
ncbi:conserved phage C-terminal domain-containing protein [Rouxiella badensis]|uniref:conserved phage C-terminal domain-containing protein n=1 Tax=Rouxiella badensis TaxID=1646377 RepID=UPI001D140851|nr:conserved phage C-terminal domain-containing protein [Rouxiella badensis]MCC3720553.1 conserved phage C-terminal domain-containing protein [Rouxiella badensis]MCC3730392.1 conserved phage C-terminal domain-containing protein [Rouxiella badensis]